MTAPGRIISARLNANGWLALCTQESGYKGRVTVYNSNGGEEYEWYSAKGYTLSAEVSPNNAEMAVLTLTEDGSRIVFFRLDSTDEVSSSTLSDELVSEIDYIDADSVLAVSEDRLAVVGEDGISDTLYDYAGKYLTGYTAGSGNSPPRAQRVPCGRSVQHRDGRPIGENTRNAGGGPGGAVAVVKRRISGRTVRRRACVV
jgi:hypothetical protein